MEHRPLLDGRYPRPVDRFWPKVEKGDGCWEWQAHRNPEGYGVIGIDRVPVGAHRVAWELTYGPIPEGIYVCHHCDNPPCVRPDHLFLGTNSDNIIDAMSKHRIEPVRPPKGYLFWWPWLLDTSH